MVGDDSSILVVDAGGVRTITLNRPAALNAFNEAMLIALAGAVRDADSDRTVRCLVITGAGRAFSAGQDLVELNDSYKTDSPIDLGPRIRDHYNPTLAVIAAMEKPVVASVNGVAAGAGCSLALACDLRIAAESAIFLEAFVNVGLVPDCGSTLTLPRLVGTARALEMAFTGRKVQAAEAARIGLVNQVVPDSELQAETSKLADKLAGQPTGAIGLTKRAFNAAWSAGLAAQLEYEAALQHVAQQTHDHREGLNAFFEKRPPRFRGD